MRRSVPSWVITVLSMAVLAAVWVGITSGGLVRDLFLPGPSDLWDGFMELVDEGLQRPPPAAACRHEPVPRDDRVPDRRAGGHRRSAWGWAIGAA